MLSNIATLESESEVTKDHSKWVLFESFCAVSYSLSIASKALSCISSEIKPDIGRKS